MKKNISVFGTQLLITVGLDSFDVNEQVDKIWKLLPEDPNGPEISKEAIRIAFIRVLDTAKAEAENIVSGITIPVDIPPEPEPIEPEKLEYNTVEEFNIRIHDGSGGKPFTWMPRNGGDYGKNIKFEFNDGITWIVKDGSITQGWDGNIHNYNQIFWFSGNDFKPGQKEYNNKRASIFGAPGSKANIVKVSYNK